MAGTILDKAVKPKTRNMIDHVLPDAGKRISKPRELELHQLRDKMSDVVYGYKGGGGPKNPGAIASEYLKEFGPTELYKKYKSKGAYK
jgi:hypothetical protein